MGVAINEAWLWTKKIATQYCKMSSQMKLYADPASPVCRAVMLLLGINKVSYEYVHVSLKNG